MKNTKQVLKIVGWACVAIMLVLLVLQFLPYWTVNDVTASISEYVWEPLKYKNNLTPHFQSLFNTKDEAGKTVKWLVGDMVNTPLIVLVCSVLTILFTGAKNSNILAYIAPTLGGIGAGIGYLVTPVLQLNGIWVVHMGLAFAVFAIGAFGLAMAIKLFIEENKRKGLL